MLDVFISYARSTQNQYDRNLAAARAAMTHQAPFDQAWREGRAMTLEQAIEDALD